MYNTFFLISHESHLYTVNVTYMCQVYLSNINYMTIFPISSENIEKIIQFNIWCHNSEQTENQISDSALKKLQRVHSYFTAHIHSLSNRNKDWECSEETGTGEQLQLHDLQRNIGIIGTAPRILEMNGLLENLFEHCLHKAETAP